MKRLEVFVSPVQVEPLVERLRMIGVPGVTLTAVRLVGRGAQRETYRGTAVKSDFVPRARLDVVAPDDQIEGLVSAVLHVVRKTEPSDGVIYVAPVDEAIRIRTGETGRDAL